MYLPVKSIGWIAQHESSISDIRSLSINVIIVNLLLKSKKISMHSTTDGV